MESPLEKVTCEGSPPVTGMAKALKIPVSLLENKIDLSSNEKETPANGDRFHELFDGVLLDFPAIAGTNVQEDRK